MVIPTELSNVTLRPLRPSDAAAIAHHANDADIARNMRDFFPHPYALADAASFIASREALPEVRDFVIAEDDVAVGLVGFVPGVDVQRLSAEIGYWLGTSRWGRGYATAALSAFVTHLFSQRGYVRLHALVFEWNEASARVLEKTGFALEARLRRAIVKQGRVADAFLYARLSDDSANVIDG